MNTIKKQHILISRADAIGDVILTLPLCGYLKSIYPESTISFLGKTYTEPVIKACGAVDAFINYDQLKALPAKEQATFLKSKKVDVIIHVLPKKEIALLAKRAGIKTRIGTTNRPYHWFTCNKLVRLSRKNSNLHEAQLNIALLKPLNIDTIPSIDQLPDFYNFKAATPLPDQFNRLLNTASFNLILHPKSHGSGREWNLDRYSELIELLPAKNFSIFITGSEKEKSLLKNWVSTLPENVTDLTGMMTLDQLIAFIASADGLIASGTGPLHIAAVAGIHALGLFPGIKPIHAGRWGPIGKQAECIESKVDDLNNISAADVYNRIKNWKIEQS